MVYLSESDSQVHLDNLDLEQRVETLKDSHLYHVITTSQRLE